MLSPPLFTNVEAVYFLLIAAQSFSGKPLSHLNHATSTLPERVSLENVIVLSLAV